MTSPSPPLPPSLPPHLSFPPFFPLSLAIATRVLRGAVLLQVLEPIMDVVHRGAQVFEDQEHMPDCRARRRRALQCLYRVRPFRVRALP